MKLLEDYDRALQSIYDYFEYKEGWSVYPIEDNTRYFWQLLDEDEVIFADTKEQLLDEASGDYYSAEIRGGIYRKDDYTMISIDTNCDGNRFLAIFDNSIEVR